MDKRKVKQESIQVGCVLPGCRHKGGGLPGQRPPWTETPPPIQGTWDQSARQEVTS